MRRREGAPGRWEGPRGRRTPCATPVPRGHERGRARRSKRPCHRSRAEERPTPLVRLRLSWRPTSPCTRSRRPTRTTRWRRAARRSPARGARKRGARRAPAIESGASPQRTPRRLRRKWRGRDGLHVRLRRAGRVHQKRAAWTRRAPRAAEAGRKGPPKNSLTRIFSFENMHRCSPPLLPSPSPIACVSWSFSATGLGPWGRSARG